jgi:cytochrome c oxidase assembly factor CtaG
MSYFLYHWSFDPILVVALVTVVAHEIGLSRLKSRSSLRRSQRRRRNSYMFYGGLGLLMLAIVSPLDYWASEYFFVHMLAHLLMSFFGPILIVAGAPWVPLMFALPVKSRRSVGRFFYLSSRAEPLRLVGRFLRSPWVGFGLFNAAMLFWHVPAMLDLAERNAFVHIWLMHTSFIATGALFWLQIIPSHPIKPSLGPVGQVSAILVTNLIMTLLAISMSILTSVSWYSVYNHVPGVSLSPFADQQLGAAILWVCGDFWALPAIYLIIRRAIETEGSIAVVFDRVMGRGAAPTIESFRSPSVPGDADE